MIAGAVALIGTAALTFGGTAFAATALGGALAGTGGIVAVAGLAAGVANVASAIVAKPPAARGSVTQLLISPDAPMPYVMGEGHFAGVLRHRRGYGATLDGVPNPYLAHVVTYSGGGPVQSISPRVDFAAVPAWYSGYLWTDTQLGAAPEASALTPHFSGLPGWSASSKLSGHAAILWNFLFDKKGKRFAGGTPVTGAYGQWVLAYDPRLDSTFAGGSGAHRLGDETTYEWTANPALHAGTYAFGRYQNDVRTIGIGLPADGIDWQAVAAWANTCDLNAWTMFGVVYEPGDRWDNLKEICAAGGAQPIPGGVLSFKWHTPVVALDTITEADIADEDMSAVAMQSYRDRINIIVPKYRSPDHNWELVQAEDVRRDAFIAEDGEERPREWPFNFVTDAGQAAQLAAYKLEDAREISPIELTCQPRLRAYRAGDCLHLDLPQLGLDGPAIILKRTIDPGTMKVSFVLMGETAAKHAFALGQTGTPPPTPTLGQTSQERDETAAGSADMQVAIELVSFRGYAADYTGVVVSGLLPDVLTPLVTLGGADLRTDDSVSYAITTNGVTATVNNTPGDPDKGRVTVASVESLNGYIDLEVTISGVPYPAKRVVMQKGVGLPGGLGGPGSKIASDNAFTGISGTSFVQITDTLTLTVATGESLYGTAPLDYQIEGTGSTASRSVTAKWQWSPTGAGTWTDFDTAVTGSLTVELPDGSTTTGHGGFTQSEAGLSAGDYDVRLMAQLSGSGRDVAFIGTATIEAKI